MRIATSTRAVLACALATAACGAGAATASAVPAVWNSPGTLTATAQGAITVKVGTTPGFNWTINCTNPSVQASASNVGSPLQGQMTGLKIGASSGCLTQGGQMALVTLLSKSSIFADRSGTTFTLGNQDLTWEAEIYSGAAGWAFSTPATDGVANFTAAWTNGTPPSGVSTATFANAVVAKVTGGAGNPPPVGQPITVSGVIRFSPPALGPLTLS